MSLSDTEAMIDGVPMLTSLQIPYLVSQGYANLRCVWTLGCPAELRLDATQRVTAQKEKEDPKSARTTEEAYRVAFAELFPGQVLPDKVGVPCCAQFALSRDQIRSRPVEDYERYRQWLLDTTLEDQVSGRVLEYSWHMIFGKESTHCPDAKECYCKTYGLCNLQCSEVGKCGERWPFPPYATIPDGWPYRGWHGVIRDEATLASLRNTSMVPPGEGTLIPESLA